MLHIYPYLHYITIPRVIDFHSIGVHTHTLEYCVQTLMRYHSATH